MFKQNNSSCSYYWYEEPYLEYLRCNHPELLNPGPAKEEKSVAETIAEKVNGDLKLQMCQLKLEMSEMKGQLGEVMLKLMEAKEEIKEEIAKGKSPAVLTCDIS